MDFKEDDIHLKESFEELKKYNFDYENLAFEGGGAKMAAYGGAIEVTVLSKDTDSSLTIYPLGWFCFITMVYRYFLPYNKQNSISFKV